jgi:glutathione-specific gamma-glutamylcyclotransferase
MWIFAYGSLIFRPSFEFVERRPAWVRGFARRFWQGSPDHRGTPESPGRVATLVHSESETCGGCAYRIDRTNAGVILAELDHREKAGFDRVMLPLLDGPNGVVFGEGLTYVAREDNAHFLGPLAEHLIAEHVSKSHGPSGPNREYVLRLHEALGELGVVDPHVQAIVDHFGRILG